MKISIQPIGPGMVQQVQRVCPDCQGEGTIFVVHGMLRDEKCLRFEKKKKHTKLGRKILFSGKGREFFFEGLYYTLCC